MVYFLLLIFLIAGLYFSFALIFSLEQRFNNVEKMLSFFRWALATVFCILIGATFFLLIDHVFLTPHTSEFLLGIIGLAVFVIPFWLVVELRHRKVTKLLSKEMPENVGKSSYVDSVNGDIYLYSLDYHTKGGQMWIVDHQKITIIYNNTAHPSPKLGRRPKMSSFFFPNINTVVLQNNSIYFFIQTSETYFREHGVLENISKNHRKELFFSPNDQHIAQAIHDRIGLYY